MSRGLSHVERLFCRFIFTFWGGGIVRDDAACLDECVDFGLRHNASEEL